jgi:hypothetical protein
MRNRTKLVIVGAAVLALGAAGGGLAVAGGSGDDTGDSEAPISGDALGRASDAALEHVGEGQVTDTEVGDEESYYEVEVSRPDGSQVDVQLDRDFHVVGDEADSENEDEPGDD